MRFLIVAMLASLVSATPAAADVVYDAAGRPFDAGDWTITGDGLVLGADAISALGPVTEPSSTGEATVGNGGVAEGLEFEVLFAANLGYCSVSVVDDAGAERVLLYTDQNPNVYGVFGGAVYGPLPRGDAPIRLTLITPAGGDSLDWSLTVTDLGSGTSITRTGIPRAVAAPFSGPITLRVTVGTGFAADLVRVRIIGDAIVPADNLSWSSVKALYR